jgi:membrane fusion protein, multidrug efflux system
MAERGIVGRLLRAALLLAVPGAAAVYGLFWYASSGRYVSTDNAYVKSHIVAVAPSISGRVVEVRVADHQLVAKGELLFRLNPDPYRIALERAEAQLGTVRNDLASMRAEHSFARAEMEEAAERMRFLDRQFRRQTELSARGAGTVVKLDEAESDLSVQRRRINSLVEKIRRIEAGLGGDLKAPLEWHPLYRAALAEYNRAVLEAGYTEIRAASDGVVSRMQLQIGEWVEAGKSVFGIVETGNAWVEANLKETQLTHIRVGQKVMIRLDAYPDLEWSGRVESISSATGAEFSAIPPQNATGNWVKVVQRLPVKIAIEPRGEPSLLRTGMTVAIRIDTERERAVALLLREAAAQVGLR